MTTTPDKDNMWPLTTSQQQIDIGSIRALPEQVGNSGLEPRPFGPDLQSGC
jgi:hypothetical protein